MQDIRQDDIVRRDFRNEICDYGVNVWDVRHGLSLADTGGLGRLDLADTGGLGLHYLSVCQQSIRGQSIMGHSAAVKNQCG